MTERKNRIFERWNDNALSTVVGTIVMNNASERENVSQRTDATRRVGAREMVLALLTDKELVRWPNDGAAIGEFLARAVANARQQGIEVSVPAYDDGAPAADVVEVDYVLPGNNDD